MDEITRDPLGPADETALEPQTSYPSPSTSHLAHLWNNVHSDPTLTDDFDAKFGPGAAAQYLAKEKAKALPWPKQNRVAFEASPQTYSTRDVGAAMVNQSPLTERMDQFVERENYRLDAERERASLSSIRSFALTAKGYEPAKSWIDLELDQAQKSVDRWTGELRGRVDAPDGSDLLRDDAGAPITYGDPALDNLASYLAQAQERLKIARQIKEDLDKQTPRSINPPSRLKIGMEMAELERDIAADEEVLATADMGPAKAAAFEYDLQQKRKRYAQLEKAAEQAMQAPALADDDPRATWLLDAARGTARGFAGMLQSGASAMQYWSKELGSMQMAGVLAGQALEELGQTIEEGTPAPPVDALDVLTMDPRAPGYLTKLSRLSADAIGSAIGSSGVVLLGAAAAHVGGSAVGGPVVGGIAGKTAAVAMNIAVGQGEFRNQLIQAFKDEGRDLPDDATVDKLLLFYGSAIGMVETASDIWILNGLGASPTAAAKQAISKSLIKALAKGVAKGAMTEGLEEFAQEWISVIGVQHAKGEGLSQQEFHQKLADSIRAASMGAIGGAGLGLGKGAVDVLKARQQTTSPTVQPGMPEAKPKADPTSPIVESGLEAGLAEAQQDPSIQPPENEKEPAKLNQQDIADLVGIWEYVREQEKKQPDDPTLNRQELAKLKGELADMGLDGIETAADVRKALETQTLDATIDTKPPSLERYGEPLEGLSEREQTTLGELADEMGIADDTDFAGVSLADQVQSQAEARFGEDPAGAEDALQAAAIRRMAEMRREGISFAPEFDALLDKLVEKEASSAVERLEREQAAQQVENLNRMLGLADLSPEAAAAIRSEVIDEARATGKPVLDVAKARSDAILAQARSAGLQRYLEAGGSLDTAELPALARGLGVAQKAMPALLARAQEEGLLRQDKRGRWLRGPKAPEIRTDLARALSERPGNADLASVFEEAAARAAKWAPAGTRFRPFASPADLPSGLREQVAAAEQQTGARATGFAHAGDVWISAYLLDPTAKMGHEVVHALRERGLITDAEINVIAARVRRAGDLFSKADRERYLQVYRGDRAKVREEEAAAGIEAYIGGYDFGPQVNGIIARILETLERLRNALRGRGFQSFNDVVDAFLEGKMAARGGVVSAPATETRADQGTASDTSGQATSAQPVPDKGPSDWQIAVETWQFVREAKRLPAPTRLTEFLRQRGGLQEDAGEIRNMLGNYNKRPGLVSKRGSNLDDATYAAWEAGYLPGEERPEINDLLAALDEDLNGRPITSRFDADIVEAKAAAAEAERELERLGIANARSEQQVKEAIIRARFSGRAAAEADGGIETPIRPDLEEAAAAEEARARLAGPDWQALAPGWDVERDGPLFSFGDEVQKAVDALRGRPLDGDIIPPGKIAEAETWFGQYALRIMGDRLHVDESSGLLRVRSPSAAGAKPSLADRLAALGLPPVGPGRGGAGQAQGAQRTGALEQAIGRDYAAVEAITGLKLDAESIETRAKAQLFNVDGWHGTRHDFSSGTLSQQIPRGMGPGMDFGFHFAIGRPSAANFIVGAPDTALAKLQYKVATGSLAPIPIQRGANILPIKIRANKPLRLTDPGAWTLPGNWYKAVEGYKGAVYDELKAHAVRFYNDKRALPDDVIYGVRDIMEKHGYDSVIYRNRVEDAGRDSMFVWHPERQVRSKFDLFHPKAVDSPGLIPSINLLGDDVRFSLENVQPEIDALGYISKALEVARGLRQNKGTPEQMLAQLKKAGVKEAEIEATGLADLLTGKSSVTKAEIVTHLVENRVRLQENVTTREFDTAEVEARVQQHIATEAEIVGRWYNMDLEEWGGDVPIRSIGGVLQFIEATTGERIEYADTPERNEDLLNDAGMTFTAGRVDAYDGHHFTLITAPDGRTMIDSSRLNYPQKGQVYPSRIAAIKAINEEAQALVAAELDRQRLQIREDVIRQMTEEEDQTAWSSYTLDPNNPTYAEVVLHLPVVNTAEMQRELQARMSAGELTPDQYAVERDRIAAESDKQFKSGHFPQRDIIGHMMLSTVQHNGQPTLLLDQIQSDWGQKLRDDGVRDEAMIAELEKARDEAKEKLDEANREKARLKSHELWRSADLTNTIRIAAADFQMKNAEFITAQAAAPGHPLVNTTDQWLNTTLRRAIRIAVDRGAAYIAIPSGDTVLSYNPGDNAGMRGFYGGGGQEGIVPKNLRKLLEKLDKATPAPDVVERVDTPTQGMKGEGFTIFRLTNKVRQEIGRNGQVMFSLEDMQPPPVPGHPTIKFSFTVFHGSPHDFDRFSMDKIGTGEGAQAYGFGLYFAEREGVAKSYKEALGSQRMKDGSPFNDADPAHWAADAIARSNGDRQAAAQLLDREMTPDMKIYEGAHYQRLLRARGMIERGDNIPEIGRGHLYEVRINANPEDFLDWDKPLSQQSEKVRQAVGPLHDIGFASEPGFTHENTLGADYVRNTKTRDRLRDAGVPGIRYLDQGSRGAASGTYNYVVFDDKLIEITAIDGNPVSATTRTQLIDGMTPSDDDVRYSFGQRKLPRSGLGEPTRSLDELVTDLGDALNVTVRVGRLAPKFSKSSGQINVKTGVIRLKSPANLEALADLGGKALLDRYGQDMHRLIRRHVGELSDYLQRGPDGLTITPAAMHIGPYVMGEFFRNYITNAAHAENTSPNFYREFEAFLDQREPRMLAHLQDIQANTEEWKATPSAGVVSSNLHSAYQPGAIERVYKGVISAIGNAVQANRTEGRDAAVESLKADVVDPVSTMAGKAYIAMADRLASIDWLRDSLLEVGRQNAARGLIPLRTLRSGEKLAIGQAEFDPGKLARLAQNAYQAGHMALMRGIRPYKGLRHGGPSWRDAMVMAMGGETEADWTPEKLKAFDTYLWSHNMIERWKDHADGKLTRFPDKVSAADHRQTVQDLAAAYPQFEPAAQLLYGYLANMRDLWFQSGLLKKETYDEMKTRRRYVPAMRVMDDNGKPDGARSPKADNLLRRFGGSERDGISPTEMIAKFTYELHYMVANNDIIRAIDTIARAVGPGGAKFAERLPASRVEALKFDTAELLKAIGKEIGIDEIDALFHLKALEEQFDTKLDSETVLFRRGEINERGETIIYLFEDGKKIPIKLHEGEIGREIYNAITGLGVDKINAFVNLMAKPSQYLRFGVTALDPAFAVRNFARDQLSASTVIPGYLAFWSSLKNVPASFRRAYQGSYTESMEQLESFGGITGSSLGADIYQSRIKRDVQALRERGIRLRDLKGWYEWIGLTETATRLGVFQVTRQRAIDDGMNEYSSVIEAAATANDLLDWTRRGANTIWILRLVPFLSSWLQGWDKLRRTAIGESNTFRNVQEAVSPYLKATEGQPLSIVEQKAFTTSRRMWMHMAIFAIVGLSLSLLYKDDEEYQEIPEHFRETHWMFKAGGFWWRYPKPFEMAAGSYLVERGLEAGLQRDPYQLWRFMTGAGELLKPTSTVPGLQLIIDQWANKARFSGAPIVSERLQAFEPWRQYEITTSELAKYLGYGTGVSPVRIDHAINSVFGGFGGLIQKASNQVLPGLYGPRQETRGEDIFKTMRMVVDPAQSSQSRKEFMERFAARTSDYQAKAKTYADEMDASSPVLADLALKNATPDQKAYALLQYHGSAYDKGQHPLSRAQEVLTITRAITREMQDSKLRNTDDLPFSPSDQRTVQEMFRQIQMREARNAMIVIGEKGYKGLKIMPVDGVLRELEAKAPEIFEVFERRMRKGKVADFDEVRNGWPTLKAEILAPGYAEEHPHKVKQR